MSGPNNRSSGPSYTCSHRPAVACDTDSPKRDCSHWPSLSGVSSDSTHSLGLFRYGSREKLTHKDSQDLLSAEFKSIRYLPLRKSPTTPPSFDLSLIMDTQREGRPGHGSALQQLLHTLNAQTASGKLASDLGKVRLNSARSVPAPSSYPVFAP